MPAAVCDKLPYSSLVLAIGHMVDIEAWQLCSTYAVYEFKPRVERR